MIKHKLAKHSPKWETEYSKSIKFTYSLESIMEHIPEENTNIIISKLLQFKEGNVATSSVLPHSMSYNFLPTVEG